MRKVLHISDLHFGAADPAKAEALIRIAETLRPDLVVVSGDLTQRARSWQFKLARAFLDRLPKPQLVVPGNHDVPLYNVFDRFINPLEKYERYITDDPSPFYSDEMMAVAGVNTARSLVIKGGRINNGQVSLICRRMSNAGNVAKVVVTHHPFDVRDQEDENAIVGGAEKAMPAIAQCGADVFLSGHLHRSNVSDATRRYKLPNGISAVIIQAGTAISNRQRGEVNSFNILEFESGGLTVTGYECGEAEADFRAANRDSFKRIPTGWARE
jgi:3',5'-cyclic AMP phosphodiesterase CpdA